MSWCENIDYTPDKSSLVSAPLLSSAKCTFKSVGSGVASFSPTWNVGADGSTSSENFTFDSVALNPDDQNEIDIAVEKFPEVKL